MNKYCEQTLLQKFGTQVVNKSYEKNINTNCQEKIWKKINKRLEKVVSKNCEQKLLTKVLSISCELKWCEQRVVKKSFEQRLLTKVVNKNI